MGILAIILTVIILIPLLKWVLKPVLNTGNLSEGKSRTVSASFKISFAEGESQIFKTLIDLFFVPEYTIGAIQQLETDKNYSYDQLRNSNVYIYIANFSKKYGSDYSQDDLSKLQKLLNSKGSYFDKERLNELILVEKKERDYSDFKRVFLSYLPKSLSNYLRKFVIIFYKKIEGLKEESAAIKNFGILPPEEECDRIFGKKVSGEMIPTHPDKINKQVLDLTHKIYFLKRLLSENHIELKSKEGRTINNEELTEMIIVEKDKYEIAKLEKSLLKDTMYSIEDIDLMNGYEFENFLKILFLKMGYEVKQTVLSGDQGADLVATKIGKTVVIQAKRCKNKVGNKAIQEVVAAINHYNAQSGIVVTNNEFTVSAIELAKSNKIELIDREKLVELVAEYL